MNYKLGSNQHIRRYKHFLGVKPGTWASVWFVAFVAAVLLPAVKPHITSPCPPAGCFVKVVYARDEAPELEQITSYIIRKFLPEGRSVATRALACFISESGLRPEAYNFNTNGTGDYSVPQINSIHVKRFGDGFMHDWRKAIDVAYQIYKERGFTAWYGRGCN